MMRRLALIGNWKMYTTPSSARTLAQELCGRLDGVKNADIVVCPPDTSLMSVADVLKDSSIALGAQNLHWEREGAFTGETSIDALKEIGCKYAIIGHSERRHIFGESDEVVAKRLRRAVEGGITGILCVGEREDERLKGVTEEVLQRQIDVALGGLEIDGLIVAYEPVWAIGTGRRAEIKDVEAAHRFIKKRLLEGFGKDASKVRVLYGGSVKPDNMAELASCEEVDGALVGGASLSADSFASIVIRAIERRIA